MRYPLSARKLCMESLEERSLLAVTAGAETMFAGVNQPAVTEAAVWVVNTTADPASWSESDSVISLREAITRAGEGDRITFAGSLAGKTITLNGSELEIMEAVSIDASSIGGMSIDADGKSGVFVVMGLSEDVPTEMTGLTISGGQSITGSGVFLLFGTLNLTDCTITGNHASDDGSGVGGGIYNSGNLTLNACSVSNNTALSFGGGIYNNGTLGLMNCLVSDNGTDMFGGGIYNSGVLSLTCSTVAGNRSGYEGAGIYNDSTAILYNTIAVGNAAELSDIDSDISLNGGGSVYAYNVLSSFTDWTGASDCLPFDSSLPLFTDFQNRDYTLAENSQAINAGNNSYVANVKIDLAGNPRIVGRKVDLGAYEYQSGDIPAEQLPAPTILTGARGVYVSYGANRHLLQWSEVENASGYELQFSTNGTTWATVSATDSAAVITGLVYGQDVQYHVRALGDGLSYTDSDWSGVKVFNVCPMDVNGDGDISGGDRSIVALMWLAEDGEDNYQNYADINGDGEISNTDRPFIARNWNKEAGDADLLYPRALRAAEVVFAAYESGDMDVDINVF